MWIGNSVLLEFMINKLRKDETRPCEKCRHLERGTYVPDCGIPQREEVEMVWTCAKAR